jgi:hypothetical protein
MKTVALLAFALLALLPVTELNAQDHPDFSGTWTRVGTAATATPTAAGAGLAGLGQTATITQTDSTLTLVRTSQLGQRTSVYNLDGTNRSNTLTLGEFSMPQRTTATWEEGGALMIRTTTDIQGSPIASSLRLSLNAEGQLEVVATSGGVAGGADSEERATYTKG